MLSTSSSCHFTFCCQNGSISLAENILKPSFLSLRPQKEAIKDEHNSLTHKKRENDVSASFREIQISNFQTLFSTLSAATYAACMES